MSRYHRILDAKRKEVRRRGLFRGPLVAAEVEILSDEGIYYISMTEDRGDPVFYVSDMPLFELLGDPGRERELRPFRIRGIYSYEDVFGMRDDDGKDLLLYLISIAGSDQNTADSFISGTVGRDLNSLSKNERTLLTDAELEYEDELDEDLFGPF